MYNSLPNKHLGETYMNTEEGEKWYKINSIQSNLDYNSAVHLIDKLEAHGWDTTNATADQRIVVLKEMGKWKD